MFPQDTPSRNLKEALTQVDTLVSAGRYLEAQEQLLSLQQEFPPSDEIRLRLDILNPLARASKFVNEGKAAFNQGEYGEAVRAFTQALELNPQDKDTLELKAMAVRERDRLRQVREALSAGQKAMREGDSGTAAIELQKVLQIDPAHSQATGLLGQIQSTQAELEREARFKAALQDADTLATQAKFDDAQFTLMELRQEFPESTEIDQRLRALDQQAKLHTLVKDSQEALEHGEFGEAVRILTEAQQLAPSDEHIRDMKVRAVQERDRLRQVREAIAGGQRALRQGEVDVAAKQFQRALQLDPANPQATALLNQLETGRQAREREAKLKAGLSLAENLITWKKLDEAEHHLAELRQSYPDSEAVTGLVLALDQKKKESASAPQLTTGPRPAPRSAAPADYARSMELAEELRVSLQKARTSMPPSTPRRSAGIGSGSRPQASGPDLSASATPAKATSESVDETLLMGSGFRSNQPPTVPKPAPSIPPPDPPAAVAVQPKTPVVPPPSPAAPKVQASAPVTPRPSTPVEDLLLEPPLSSAAPAVQTTPSRIASPVHVPGTQKAKMSPVVFVVLGVLTAIIAVVAFLILRHS